MEMVRPLCTMAVDDARVRDVITERRANVGRKRR